MAWIQRLRNLFIWIFIAFPGSGPRGLEFRSPYSDQKFEQARESPQVVAAQRFAGFLFICFLGRFGGRFMLKKTLFGGFGNDLATELCGLVHFWVHFFSWKASLKSMLSKLPRLVKPGWQQFGNRVPGKIRYDKRTSMA